MKTLSRLVGLFFLPALLAAANVKVGDSFETVQAALGEPRGQVQLGQHARLYFDRGEVELSAGVVTRVALRSEEAQAKYEAQRQARELRSTELNTTRLARLSVEGEALKARLLADESFKRSPLSEQLAAWRSLKFSYPMVACSEQLTLLQIRYHEQQATLQRQYNLEQRVAALETDVRTYNTESASWSNMYLVGDADWRRTYSENNLRYAYENRWRHRRSNDCDDYGLIRADRDHGRDTRHPQPAAENFGGGNSQPITSDNTAAGWLGVPRFVPLNPGRI